MARLDKDPPERESAYANTGEVPASDAPILENEMGRTAGEGDLAPAESVEAEEIAEKSVGTRPVGDRTNFHLSGTGAIETDDGLDETSELIRAEAEEIDEDQPLEPDDVPVFDRADHI